MAALIDHKKSVPRPESNNPNASVLPVIANPIESTLPAATGDVTDNPEWDRPFGDTGRGDMPVLVTAENSHFTAHLVKNDPSNLGVWKTLSSARVNYLIAGALAGGIARTFTHPFDRAQTSMLLFGHEPRFQSMTRTFRTFVVEQGIPSLARGLRISLLKTIPEVGLKFTVYEETKRLQVIHHTLLQGKTASFSERFIAGSAAGAVSHIAVYPIGVVQTRMASQKPAYGKEFSGIRDAFVKLYRVHGFLGFYRGILVSLTAMVPSMGLDFAIYGRLKKLYKEHFHTKGQHPPAYVLLACSTVSSCVAHVTVYPLIRPRIRMQANDAAALEIQTLHKTMFSYLLDVYRQEGLLGLYRGLTPSLAKVVPAVSLSYYFYERISQYLLQHDKPKSFIPEI